MQVIPARNRAGSRHQSARRPVLARPSLHRTATTTAAVGAVFGVATTGAFAMVMPAAMGGIVTAADTADASENLGPAALAAESTALPATRGAHVVSAGYFSPVAFMMDPAIGSSSADAAAGAGDIHIASLDKAGRLAEELAALHAKAQREQTNRARVDSLIERGGLDGWIAEALRVMDLPQSLAPGIKQIILAESNGNPNAINRWDANAAHGTPSQGLMQTIPSTFRTYVDPSLANRPITDPVANITAGVRYMIANYGIDTVAAGGRTNNHGSYLGY